jgi:hypothetical protein
MSLKAMIWALDLQVPGTVKLVLVTLGEYADKEGVCWPGYPELSSRASVSEGTVRRSIKNLVEWGLIEAIERFHPSGKQRSNLYKLRLDRQAPDDVASKIAKEIRGTTEDTPRRDDSEKADETTACTSAVSEGDHGGHPPDSTQGSHTDHPEGVTQTTPNRTFQIEPSPLPPNRSVLASTNKTAAPSIDEALQQNSPAVPVGEVAGSAGKAKEPDHDPNSEEFKRLQFKQLVDCWQQAGLIRFVGDETAAWKIFRAMSLEDRVEALAKAANYLKGKKAEWAAWNGEARAMRSRQAPKPATVKEYLGTKLFKLLGMPSEPVTVEKPKPVSTAWIAAVSGSKRSQFDRGAVFVNYPSPTFNDWIAAFQRAGLGMLGYRGVTIGGERKQGAWFATEHPPREEEFQIIEQDRGAA